MFIETARQGAQKEHIQSLPYAERMMQMFEGFRLKEYCTYDEHGDLFINGTRVLDIVGSVANATHIAHPGTPLEVVDPSIAFHFAEEFIEKSKNAAGDVGYDGGMSHVYATKAAPTAEVVVNALAAGWQLETSSEQDLYNIFWLKEQGLLPEECTVVCNGFKLDPKRTEEWTVRNVTSEIPVAGDVKDTIFNRHETYAEMIVAAAQAGIHVVPIIESMEELVYFHTAGVKMDVGLRFKAYDAAKQNGDFEHLVARHGMNADDVKKAARLLEDSKNLTLTTFHAMIGAAESIPIDKHVGALTKAAETYFDLKKYYSSLNIFNIGGGIPSAGIVRYDHDAFLHALFAGMKKQAERYNAPMPEIQFECGSFVAAEAAYAVGSVKLFKENNVEPDGSVIPWAIGDYSFMRGIIDQVAMGSRFIVLAANYGDRKARAFRLGDPTCDHDGYLRSEANRDQYVEKNTVLLPDVQDGYGPDTYKEPLIFIILGIQAYEEQLTGVDGVGHCQIGEPIDVIVVRAQDGKVASLEVQKFKGPRQAMDALGYNAEMLPTLQAIAAQKAKK